MERILLLLLLSFALLYASVGKITVSSGDVTITKGDKTLKAVSGVEIDEKDKINTKAGSRAQLVFKDGTAISIGGNTAFKVDEFLYEEGSSPNNKSKAKFGVTEGAFRAITGKIGKINPDKFKLETKTATIGIRGTRFLGMVPPNGPEVIACTKGAISVTLLAPPVVPTKAPTAVGAAAPTIAPAAKSMDIQAGQMTTVSTAGVEPPKAFAPADIKKLESAAGGGEAKKADLTQSSTTTNTAAKGEDDKGGGNTPSSPTTASTDDKSTTQTTTSTSTPNTTPVVSTSDITKSVDNAVSSAKDTATTINSVQATTANGTDSANNAPTNNSVQATTANGTNTPTNGATLVTNGTMSTVLNSTTGSLYGLLQRTLFSDTYSGSTITAGSGTFGLYKITSLSGTFGNTLNWTIKGPQYETIDATENRQITSLSSVINSGSTDTSVITFNTATNLYTGFTHGLGTNLEYYYDNMHEVLFYYQTTAINTSTLKSTDSTKIYAGTPTSSSNFLTANTGKVLFYSTILSSNSTYTSFIAQDFDYYTEQSTVLSTALSSLYNYNVPYRVTLLINGFNLSRVFDNRLSTLNISGNGCIVYIANSNADSYGNLATTGFRINWLELQSGLQTSAPTISGGYLGSAAQASINTISYPDSYYSKYASTIDNSTSYVLTRMANSMITAPTAINSSGTIGVSGYAIPLYTDGSTPTTFATLGGSINENTGLVSLGINDSQNSRSYTFGSTTDPKMSAYIHNNLFVAAESNKKGFIFAYDAPGTDYVSWGYWATVDSSNPTTNSVVPASLWVAGVEATSAILNGLDHTANTYYTYSGNLRGVTMDTSSGTSAIGNLNQSYSTISFRVYYGSGQVSNGSLIASNGSQVINQSFSGTYTQATNTLAMAGISETGSVALSGKIYGTSTTNTVAAGAFAATQGTLKAVGVFKTGAGVK